MSKASEKEIKKAYAEIDSLIKEISTALEKIEKIADTYGLKIELPSPCSGIKYKGKGYHPSNDEDYDSYDDEDIEDVDPLSYGYWIPSRICYND